jgi:hypothetical protein
MATGLRCFWVANDGRLLHVGLRRFVSIFHDGAEVVPEFAGKMVPVIEAVYDIVNRKPTQLVRIKGYRFPFDVSGRLDVARQRRLYPWTALVDEQDEALGRGRSSLRRIDSRIAANRIRKEVFFDPTPDQVRAVLLALGIVTPSLPPRPRLRVIGRRRGRPDRPLPSRVGT